MKIVMLKTAVGSPDGISVKNFAQGETYEVPDDLAHVFVEQMKVAKPFEEPKATGNRQQATGKS